MKPLGLGDSLAVPLYDAFDGTAQNTEPYTAIEPKIAIDERNTEGSPAAAASKRMNFRKLDGEPQRELDAVLWKSIHGDDAVPPPPGPNAAGEEARGDDG
jgi:hypothetical protein